MAPVSPRSKRREIVSTARLAARGRPFVVLDSNGPIPGLVGKYFDAKMPKYFKGPDRPRLGDLAYTEAAMFGV